MVNEQRLIDEFLKYVKIDSESKEEKKMAAVMKGVLEELGATVTFDNAGEKVGSNCNNLVAKISGDETKPSILLNAHLDTVKPGKGIEPIIDGDVIKTDGSTVLGADCKSGLAVIVEVLKVLKEKNIPHPPLEIVLTVAEESGVAGGREFDYSLVNSNMGISLDSEEVDVFTIGAPSKATIDITVHGLESHAGVEPENGISAIVVAANAISKLKLGRIDDETTANIGTIESEFATNIVPNKVEIKAEARSLDMDKLNKQLEHIINTFKEIADQYSVTINGETKKASVEENIFVAYESFKISEDEEIYGIVKRAAENLGLEPEFKMDLGGSDSNTFNAHGIKMILVGTGMQRVHTKKEFIKKSDMIKSANLLLEILKEI